MNSSVRGGPGGACPACGRVPREGPAGPEVPVGAAAPADAAAAGGVAAGVADLPAGADHGGVCEHLLALRAQDGVRRFTGAGLAYDLVCFPCRAAGAAAVAVCGVCFDAAAERHDLETIDAAALEVATEARGLGLVRGGWVTLGAAAAAWVPTPGRGPSAGLAVSARGELARLDLASGRAEALGRLEPAGVDFGEPLTAVADPGGRFLALANSVGRTGAVYDLAAGRQTMALDRGGYRNEHCLYSLAFFEHRGRPRLVFPADWNRLEVADPARGAVLTGRAGPIYVRGEGARSRYDDYFHSGVATSPDGRYLAMNGWVWGPAGVLRTVDLRSWLEEEPYEVEAGESRRALCVRHYLWDAPLCWLGDRELAVWGFGDDDELMIDAACFFDAATGEEAGWFPGPRGEFYDAGWLVSVDEAAGFAAWDRARGARVFAEEGYVPAGYLPGAGAFYEIEAGRGARLSRLTGPDGS